MQQYRNIMFCYPSFVYPLLQMSSPNDGNSALKVLLVCQQQLQQKWQMSSYESSSAESNRILLDPTNICNNGNACTVGYERTHLCWITTRAHCLYRVGYMDVWHTLVHSPMWWRRQMLFRWTEGWEWEGLGGRGEWDVGKCKLLNSHTLHVCVCKFVFRARGCQELQLKRQCNVRHFREHLLLHLWQNKKRKLAPTCARKHFNENINDQCTSRLCDKGIGPPTTNQC